MPDLLAGAFAGMLMGPVCSLAAGRLLKARGKEFSETTQDKFFLSAILAVYCGACVCAIPFSAELIYMFLIAFPGATLALTDIKCRIIPNELPLSMIVLTLVFGIPGELGFSGFPEFNIFRSLIGLALCFAVFMLPALFRKSVGAGDVKLAAAMGFVLGFENSLFTIVLMGSLILASCFFQRRMPAMKYLRSQIPMGPFLSAAMAAVLIIRVM